MDINRYKMVSIKANTVFEQFVSSKSISEVALFYESKGHFIMEIYIDPYGPNESLFKEHDDATSKLQ